MSTVKSNKKFGQLLLESGLITSAQLDEALLCQKEAGGRIGEVVVKLGFINEAQLQEVVAKKLDLPLLSLSDLEIDPETVKLIPADTARQYAVIAVFKMGNALTVAMADPLNFVAVDKIAYTTKMEIRRVVATESEIEAAIDKYYSISDTMGQTMERIESSAARTDDAKLIELQDLKDISSDMPVVDLTNAIIARAVKRKASDIHLQPDQNVLKIRFRVDGLMEEVAVLPGSIYPAIISRVKVMSNIDVSEKRLPQDGRFRLNFNKNDIDFRVSTLPTIFGEKTVIRILDKSNLVLDLSQMGFSPRHYQKWLDIIDRPEGLILITGPTGSGKTTTLYAVLKRLNSPQKNIVTVEDPVEYKIGNLTQVQINDKAGLHFAGALRSIVRQNPDILMVGEIRDLATAEISIRASLTGHLVLSTLHTSDAPVTVGRLIDMGVEPYLVSTSITAILAQRLVRVVCRHCSQEVEADDAIRHKILPRLANPDTRFHRGTGCPRCNNSGYAGRTAIHELLIVTPEIKNMITRKADHVELREAALRSGMISLLDDGLEKASRGITTLEEILRVTHYEDFVSGYKTEMKEKANAIAI